MRSLKALFAVTGTKEELQNFEGELKAVGISGTMANEASRILALKWIVVYADFNAEDGKTCELFYAYRSTNCKYTSKPKIISIKTAKKRINSNFYVDQNKILLKKFRK